MAFRFEVYLQLYITRNHPLTVTMQSGNLFMCVNLYVCENASMGE